MAWAIVSRACITIQEIPFNHKIRNGEGYEYKERFGWKAWIQETTYRCEESIKINVKETEWGSVDWIQLAYNRIQSA
jgi:hypothetical protein